MAQFNRRQAALQQWGSKASFSSHLMVTYDSQIGSSGLDEQDESLIWNPKVRAYVDKKLY